MRIPSKENRSFKDDLDRVACRPRFWSGWDHVCTARCLSAAWISNAASGQEEQDLWKSLPHFLLPREERRLPHPQHELQANAFSATWTWIWAAGSREHRRSRLCAPIVTRPPLHLAAIAEFCDVAVRAMTHKDSWQTKLAANMLPPNDEACQNMIPQSNFFHSWCFAALFRVKESLALWRQDLFCKKNPGRRPLPTEHFCMAFFALFAALKNAPQRASSFLFSKKH